jgi:hypothetical protein
MSKAALDVEKAERDGFPHPDRSWDSTRGDFVLALAALNSAALKRPHPLGWERGSGSAASSPPRDGSVAGNKELLWPADNFETPAARPGSETLPGNPDPWGLVAGQGSGALAAARGSEEQAGRHGCEAPARFDSFAARTGFEDTPKTSRRWAAAVSGRLPVATSGVA